MDLCLKLRIWYLKPMIKIRLYGLTSLLTGQERNRIILCRKFESVDASGGSESLKQSFQNKEIDFSNSWPYRLLICKSENGKYNLIGCNWYLKFIGESLYVWLNT